MPPSDMGKMRTADCSVGKNADAEADKTPTQTLTLFYQLYNLHTVNILLEVPPLRFILASKFFC